MSGFEPQTVFKPSSKFDNARHQKYANDWFKNQIIKASERVDEIKAELNNLPEQPGDAFSILKNFHNNYTDYDFFKWVVLYCEAKDSLIQLGKQCFVVTKEEIMQNHGIVKNNGYSSVFIQLSSLYGYRKVTSVFDISPVYNSIDELVSKYYFDDIISKMYRLYITPRFEGHVPEVINNTNYNKITYEYNENTQREPISIVSFLRRHDVKIDINNNVNNFVVDVYNVKTNISNDIRYILSCAILIQLNSHYQKVINWTTGLQMVPNWSVDTYPRKIDTAWTFPDFPDTGSPKIKKSYTDDLDRRLMQYHENLDNNIKGREEKNFNEYQENRKNYPKRDGGSKTKKQKKQRQRKQKSKRKKN